jgi:hypothetical protein
MQFRRFKKNFESEILYLTVWHIQGCINWWVGAIKRESGGLQLQAELQAAFLNVIQLFSYFHFILSFQLQYFFCFRVRIIL